MHDVFVLQIEGAKRWVIHEPVLPDPLRDRPWTDHRAAVADRAAHGTPHLDTMLRPGDVLYLPRGWLHSAQAQGQVSIHLTLGVHAWTRYALAEQLTRAALAALGDDPAMRRSLPWRNGRRTARPNQVVRTARTARTGRTERTADGADGTGGVLDLVRERLLAAVAEADPAPLFHRARRSRARPAPLGPVAQLAALSGLTTTSPVRLRKALSPGWREHACTPASGTSTSRHPTSYPWPDCSTAGCAPPATSASHSPGGCCGRACWCPRTGDPAGPVLLRRRGQDP